MSDPFRNEPLLNEAMATEPRRRPFRGENWAWLIWHRARFHDVDGWGWVLGPYGSYRNWLCLSCHRTWR